MDAQYTDYKDVPWYRKNAFALLLGLVFSPPLLPILLTGDIYYRRNGEVRTYSRPARYFLIFWALLTCIALTLPLVKTTNQISISQIFDNRPSEEQFISQMQGVWRDDKDTYTCTWNSNENYIGCETTNNLIKYLTLKPHGKLDPANNSLPVKNNLIANGYTDELFDLIQTKKWDEIFSYIDFALAPNTPSAYSSSSFSNQLKNNLTRCYKEAMWSNPPLDKLGLPSLSDVDAKGMTVSLSLKGMEDKLVSCSEALDAWLNIPTTKGLEILRNGLISRKKEASFTLRNTAKNPREQFLPALLSDRGDEVAFSFIRELSSTEISEAIAKQGNIKEKEAAKESAALLTEIRPELEKLWTEKALGEIKNIVKIIQEEQAPYKKIVQNDD